MSLAGLKASNGFLGNRVVSCATTAGLAGRDMGQRSVFELFLSSFFVTSIKIKLTFLLQGLGSHFFCQFHEFAISTNFFLLLLLFIFLLL